VLDNRRDGKPKQPATETSIIRQLVVAAQPAHHNLNNQQLKPKGFGTNGRIACYQHHSATHVSVAGCLGYDVLATTNRTSKLPM
jgi:hypothetical protein